MFSINSNNKMTEKPQFIDVKNKPVSEFTKCQRECLTMGHTHDKLRKGDNYFGILHELGVLNIQQQYVQARETLSKFKILPFVATNDQYFQAIVGKMDQYLTEKKYRVIAEQMQVPVFLMSPKMSTSSLLDTFNKEGGYDKTDPSKNVIDMIREIDDEDRNNGLLQTDSFQLFVMDSVGEARYQSWDNSAKCFHERILGASQFYKLTFKEYIVAQMRKWVINESPLDHNTTTICCGEPYFISEEGDLMAASGDGGWEYGQNKRLHLGGFDIHAHSPCAQFRAVVHLGTWKVIRW